MMKASIRQLKDEADELAAFRTQVEEEESWARKSFFQLESLYCYLMAEHAKATKKPRVDESGKVTGSYLLLENGSHDSQVSDHGDSSELDARVRNGSLNVSRHQINNGNDYAEELFGDFVIFKQKEDRFCG